MFRGHFVQLLHDTSSSSGLPQHHLWASKMALQYCLRLAGLRALWEHKWTLLSMLCTEHLNDRRRRERTLKFECLICPETCVVLWETVQWVLLPQQFARPCHYLHFRVQQPEADLPSDVREVGESGFEPGRGLIPVSGDFFLPRRWHEWLTMSSGTRQWEEHEPGQHTDLGLKSNLPFNQLSASFTISEISAFCF